MVLIGIIQILLDININLIKEWSIGNIPNIKLNYSKILYLKYYYKEIIFLIIIYSAIYIFKLLNIY